MNLNADLGESWYKNTVGNDQELMPLLDSCNIACGFHGGDAYTILKTIELAVEHGVAVGAHPSFADRENFGRKRLEVEDEVLYAQLLYQVGALKSMVESLGEELNHLKPHGALYHYANESPAAAQSIAIVAAELEIPIIYGPPKGYLREFAEAEGLEFWAEGFADRAYEPTLHLRPRNQPGAVLESEEAARTQVQNMLKGHVVATDGKSYPLEVQTICIHGDHEGAVERAEAVREILNSAPKSRIRKKLQ
ncbi:LamB/YcsF family protein [Neolewinella aurantiaca]|uniref:LamB/YcsF family protein n=1 Tax=Neolewinella aurantiaca TaxID=2602767 RepID=A0A5C7FNH4_9BACT|nr:5-oxoprolinase subunit PxpA [Neolewinella aurantiaca]TXF91737.1 LamB/YcsF family protein [Neolewinella aurantiaca]